MKHKVDIFFDLDKTLFDSDALVACIREDLERYGKTREEIERTSKQASAQGYSFEKHLGFLRFKKDFIKERSELYRALLSAGDQFLFPGVEDSMQRLSQLATCHLLTFGLPRYQREKARGIVAFQGLFTTQHFVWRERTKGDVLKQYGPQNAVYFVDDTPDHLVDARMKAPWVRCIRMAWPGKRFVAHQNDGIDWPVVRSLETIVKIIEGITL